MQFFSHMSAQLTDAQLKDLKSAVNKESRKRAHKNTKACERMQKNITSVLKSSIHNEKIKI